MENINQIIFRALQVSKLSKVPFLFMGNPGTGKTTSVELFCNLQEYELILLRGSQSSPEEILGYEVNGGNKDNTTTLLLPRWYANLKKKSESGKKILLFLDEITTASEPVQGALLHLIFERRVGDEKLPDDTLIVAAGNYSQNLSNSFNLIPPLMNRFCIINIIPKQSDLRSFLGKYHPSKSSLDLQLEGLSKAKYNSDELDNDQLNDLKLRIEESIYQLTDSLITSNELDLTVTDLKDIYSDSETVLPGFVSYRTLNYYRECCINMYLQYGVTGLRSDTFDLITTGLVGVGTSRDTSSSKSSFSSTKLSKFTDRYKSYVLQAVTEFRKSLTSKSNGKIKELSNLANVSHIMTDTEIMDLANIVNSMDSEEKMSIEDSVLKSLSGMIVNNIRNTVDSISNSSSKSEVNKAVTKFNSVVSTFLSLIQPRRASDPNDQSSDLRSSLENNFSNITKLTFKLDNKVRSYKSSTGDPFNELIEVKGITFKDQFYI